MSKEQGEEIAKQNNMAFYESSAKSGEGIKEAFESIARDIIKSLDLKGITRGGPNKDKHREPIKENVTLTGKEP